MKIWHLLSRGAVVVALMAVWSGCLLAGDLELVTANMGRETQVADGETILSPNLSVTPPRKTQFAGASLVFSASGTTNPITWFMTDNASGGSLSMLTSTSALYHAGSVDTVVDTVEAWDGGNRFGRAYVNVISAADVARAGKSIIIAGRSEPNNWLWPTTDYLGDLCYNTLLYRGLAKNNIRYLNPETNQDVDGNGELDDIACEPTLANVTAAFTSWAGNSDKLFVYLVDHGDTNSSGGYLRLSSSEILTASNLDLWLDGIQDTWSNDVTVVVDCCRSGSFVEELTYAGPAKRIVISSCATTQLTYFVAGGLVSFSDAFFSGMMMGLDVKNAFLLARDAMSTYQAGQLDANHDGVYTPGTDETSAEGRYIGASFVVGKDIPQVGLVLGNQLLYGDTTATLWADNIVSVYPIDRVWCLVIPPGHNPDPDNPVGDLPELNLTYNPSSGRYEASYSGFSEEGTYKVIYYAKDIWSSVSSPRQSYVTQNGYDERVILVAAAATNDANLAQINNMATLAYHTFRSRWFDNEAIYYLNPTITQDFDGDGTNEVDAVPSLENLANAITNWAMSANKLTVYLIGEGTNGLLRLNETETLTAANLDGWLDSYQQSNAEASVIMEFSGAGGFIPALSAPSGQTRICLASAKVNQRACWGNGGLVSFCQYFLSDVLNGYSMGDAYANAKLAIKQVTGALRQEAQLDDNGDGASSWTDGTLARRRHIGTAFMTGADAPVIAHAMPDTLLTGTNSLRLWVNGVTDMDGVSNVWCLITRPDYQGEGDLPQTNLAWNAASSRYEAQYDDFTAGGTYVLSFYAQDAKGVISSPVQTTVLTADAYEPDNTNHTAAPINLEESQSHNFHAADDEDWVRFYAVRGVGHDVYEVNVAQQGTNSNVGLELFYENPDGTLSNVDLVDYGSPGPGVTKTTYVNFAVQPELPDGFYCIRITPLDPAAWGLGSEYDVSVVVTVGSGGGLIVVVVDKLNNSHSPPGATVVVDGGAPQALNGSNSVTLSLATGTHTVSVPAIAGYRVEESPVLSGQADNPMSYYGNPKTTAIKDNAWQSVVFQFVPMGRIDGVVRDRVTGAWAAGAKLEFRARNGAISNLVYDGFPNNAAYESPWYSEANGAFSTNIWLPTVDWDLAVTMAGYSNGWVSGAITNLQPGVVTNLGTIWLAPLDTNGNGVADTWEQQYFAGQTLVLTNHDDDDGMDNVGEYWCGTDPTNRESVLRLLETAGGGTNGFTLSWPVVPGRRYRVMATDSLSSGLWPLTNGPWDAASGQTIMQWTDAFDGARTNRFYRIGLQAP